MKELKDLPGYTRLSVPCIWWNPVKELKVGLVLEQLSTSIGYIVESGEGIERFMGSLDTNFSAFVESGEGIESRHS